MDHKAPSYQTHMVTVTAGEGSNYRVSCTCSWYSNLASRSDVRAAELALEHVKEAQPAAILKRAGLLQD